MRNTHDPWLNTFDTPDMFNSCSRRNVTTTPIQSLMLFNGKETLSRAQAFAARIARAHPKEAESQINLAYEVAVGRLPEEEERAAAGKLVNRPDDRQSALVDFCHVLLCANEFVYVD